MSWQDPAALGLAAALAGAALWWRRWLIKRGAASHCAQCAAGEPMDDKRAKAPVKPTVIDPSRMRIGRPPSGR